MLQPHCPLVNIAAAAQGHYPPVNIAAAAQGPAAGAQGTAAAGQGPAARLIQHSWHWLGDDVVNLVQNFYRTGMLPPDLNKTFIVLIPKKNAHVLPQYFRRVFAMLSIRL